MDEQSLKRYAMIEIPVSEAPDRIEEILQRVEQGRNSKSLAEENGWRIFLPCAT